MDIQQMNVTPAMAEAWLNANNTNRKLRDGVVEKYAEDMRHGRWTDCPAPIAFYADGDLADGQHRLFAICDAQVTVRFPIARGLDREAGLNIDTGLGRSLVDNARISGADSGLSNELLSTVRAIEDGERGNAKTARSNAERLVLVERHREAAQWVMQHGPRGKVVRNAVVLGALGRAYYHEKDRDRLARYCAVLGSGFSDGVHESAAIAMREYLRDNAGATMTAWRDTFLKVQNSIHYFMQQKGLTIIKGVKDEAYPLRRTVAAKAPAKARAKKREAVAA